MILLEFAGASRELADTLTVNPCAHAAQTA
jgi:hypothetical protein